MQELNTDDGYDIMLQVKDEKMDQIKAQMLDGRKCIIIPLEENEHVTINGMTDLY